MTEKEKLIVKESKKYNILHMEHERYGGRTARGKAFLRANDSLHKKVKSGILLSKTMLDVGCGKGFFIDFFKKNFSHLEITGLDIAYCIKELRMDLNIVIGSASNMEMFPDNNFDMVVHQDGMEHIPEALEKDVMNEIYRVSNKYMYFTIATHDVHDRNCVDLGLGKIHINLKTADRWKQIFTDFFVNGKKVTDFVFTNDSNWCYVYVQKR